MTKEYTEREIDRIIEMAWEDRTPFEAIHFQFGVDESDVIKLMRKHMKASSFRMWRKRVQGRSAKHQKLRSDDVNRFKSSRQKHITHNKISKSKKIIHKYH
ncbi:TIGR03643 family protein [Psychroflexus sp. S27]|uniref:TIGR03643 family protein n=1 Tax=Psychroflexus sp. S27 TaxID=1982757 RepID=UPI000C298EB1|nr:TIGR03643 family protein [Psychroflexus sp. S27]PJX24680.1 TIGR03643 family protein [Psychroflexus sp. S27]